MAVEQRALLDIVEVTGGGTPSRDLPRYWGGDIPWATVKDLSRTTVTSTVEFITSEGLKNSASNIVPTGTIILATRINPGRVALAGVSLAINQDLKGLLPREGIDPAYLLHFLCSIRSRLEHMSAGSTVKGLTLESLSRIVVPVPGLPKQRRIAATLHRADEILRKRRESLQLLQQFLRCAYASIVGPRNPTHSQWPEFAIADLAEQRNGAMCTGPFGSALRHGEFTDEGDVAVLGIDNAVENRFRRAERRFVTRERYESQFTRYTVAGGDVLVTIMGTTGKSAVVPEDVPVAITTKHLAAISVDRTRVCPEFLSHAIHSDAAVLAQIAAANRGAIMAGLNLGVIRRLKVRLPPMSQQRQFHELVVRTRAVQGKCAESKRAEEQLTQSLAHEFFEVR